MRLLLESISFKNCTVGKLYYFNRHDDQIFVCYILERPWRDNEPFVSCVPAGDYSVIPTTSNKFGQTHYLKSINSDCVGLTSGERTHILFHAGTTIKDSAGCLITGMMAGVYEGVWALYESRTALKAFNRLIDGYQPILTIKRR